MGIRWAICIVRVHQPSSRGYRISHLKPRFLGELAPAQCSGTQPQAAATASSPPGHSSELRELLLPPIQPRLRVTTNNVLASKPLVFGLGVLRQPTTGPPWAHSSESRARHPAATFFFSSEERTPTVSSVGNLRPHSCAHGQVTKVCIRSKRLANSACGTYTHFPTSSSPASF